jgi:hypothetical protein
MANFLSLLERVLDPPAISTEHRYLWSLEPYQQSQQESPHFTDEKSEGQAESRPCPSTWWDSHGNPGAKRKRGPGAVLSWGLDLPAGLYSRIRAPRKVKGLCTLPGPCFCHARTEEWYPQPEEATCSRYIRSSQERPSRGCFVHGPPRGGPRKS